MSLTKTGKVFLNKLLEVFPNFVFQIHTELQVESSHIVLSFFICVFVRNFHGVAVHVPGVAFAR